MKRVKIHKHNKKRYKVKLSSKYEHQKLSSKYDDSFFFNMSAKYSFKKRVVCKSETTFAWSITRHLTVRLVVLLFSVLSSFDSVHALKNIANK